MSKTKREKDRSSASIAKELGIEQEYNYKLAWKIWSMPFVLGGPKNARDKFHRAISEIQHEMLTAQSWGEMREKARDIFWSYGFKRVDY